MSKVFVLDTNKQVLNSVHPGEARRLLSSGKAAVFKRYPFTIILKNAVKDPVIEPLRIKIDPGSKTTGLAIMNDASGEIVFAAELIHRGQVVKNHLDDRRVVRRSRRQRHTRYRKCRFSNRRKPKGWIAPSLMSRVQNVLTWVQRLQKLCSIVAISQELVKFDLQKMENPEISGIEYQQGTLQGYEVREYLLEKWQRKCTYCGIENVPLEIEHIQAKANNGSNRISNLCLACEACNKTKGTQDIRMFLAKKPELLQKILAQAKRPLKDATAVNITRWKLFENLKALGLPVEVGSGGLTKYNRIQRGLSKEHWLDAACVGKSTPVSLFVNQIRVLQIKATGHGNRQMCQVDKYGFPKQYRKRQKKHFGFQTGDMVRVVIPPTSRSKYSGTYVTRIKTKASGSFTFFVGKQEIPCSHKYCSPLHRSDGYQYA